MLREILKEIEEMEYPEQIIGRGMEEADITDPFDAAAYGFAEARERIAEIIRNHMDGEGWILCSEQMPENEKEVEITYTWESYVEKGKTCYGTARAFYTDGTMTTEDSDFSWEDTDNWEYCEEKDAAYIPEGWWECVAFCENFSAVDQKVIAWRHCPEPYRPGQKTVGENYKRQIMGRFLRQD